MIDSTSLFLHVLAAAGMIAGGIGQVVAGSRVRTADAVGRFREWSGLARLAGFVVLGSAVVSFLTGGHLAGAVWTTDEASGFSYPFITLGAAALVVLAPIGPMVAGRTFRRLLRDLPDRPDAALSPEVRRAATAPGLWGAVHSLLGVAVGLVAVMTYKPGWAATAIVLVATFAAGWASGVAVTSSSTLERRDQRAATTDLH